MRLLENNQAFEPAPPDGGFLLTQQANNVIFDVLCNEQRARVLAQTAKQKIRELGEEYFQLSNYDQEPLLSDAAREIDAGAAVRQIGELIMNASVAIAQDSAASSVRIGDKAFSLEHFGNNGFPYMASWDAQTEQQVHYTDAGLADYNHARNATTSDYRQVLRYSLQYRSLVAIQEVI